ncbi:MAG: energy transducer TonB, partial [Firmicutes bacterium]|nr:energy transducer TonB [Bacillota bacterium]
HAPQPLPNIPNDEAVYEIDFAKLHLVFQPMPPPLPIEAKERQIQGNVVVFCYLNREGLPFKVEAISGPKELHSYVENYLMTWRFKPTLMDGHPRKVKFKITIPIRRY